MASHHIRDDESFKYYRTNSSQRKEKRILQAVVHDDLPTIIDLLDSPKWYQITDKHGLNLLHVAILQNSRECFDYMLALTDFPLEMTSDYGETALITSILTIDLDKQGSFKADTDYFALELIKRGADIFCQDSFGYTTLSCCALKHHVKMAELFIQKGVHLDGQDVYGNTALHHALDHESPQILEFIALLLCSGCNPRIRNKDGLTPFEMSIFHCGNCNVQQILFDYTYDTFTEMITKLSVLLRLAMYRSSLLHKFQNAIVDDFMDGGYVELFYVNVEYLTGYVHLFYVEVDYLIVLIEKFCDAIGAILPSCTLCDWSRNVVTFEKVEFFLTGQLKNEMVKCIQNQEDDLLLQHLINSDLDEFTITKIICYLLSYGLRLTELGLLKIYRKFGYCELFKILLHLEFEPVKDLQREIFPLLLYDIKMDLKGFLQDFKDYSKENVYDLLRLFSDRDLNDYCYELYGESIKSKIDRLPRVPLLVELARNVFRKYFISRFKIETCRRFYTLMNCLVIGNVYKKIITFETALY